MEATTVNELFLDSLERCSRSKKFIPTFYHRFQSASDDISDKFRHTNFERQNRMLLRSLRLAAHAAAGHPEAARVRREADSYKADLIRGFETQRENAPLVRLRDGRWIPNYPSRN